MSRFLPTILALATAAGCAAVQPYSAPRACVDVEQSDVHHAAFKTVMERGWRLINNDERRGMLVAIEKTDDKNRRVHWTFFVSRPLLRVRRTVQTRDGSQRAAPWVSSSLVPASYEFTEEQALLARLAAERQVDLGRHPGHHQLAASVDGVTEVDARAACPADPDPACQLGHRPDVVQNVQALLHDHKGVPLFEELDELFGAAHAQLPA